MNDLTSRKLKMLKNLSVFIFCLKEEVKVLALRPGTLMLESQWRFSNSELAGLLQTNGIPHLRVVDRWSAFLATSKRACIAPPRFLVGLIEG